MAESSASSALRHDDVAASACPVCDSPVQPPAPTPIRRTAAVSAAPRSTTGTLRPDKALLAAWLLLLLDGGTTYGYKLRRDLVAHGFSIDPGTVYRALASLQRDGYVKSRWGGARGGPRRRFYHLTPKGRHTLDERAELIGATRDTYDAFLGAYEQPGERRPTLRGVGGLPPTNAPR